MFPSPPNSSGGRLLKMSDIKVGEYLGRLLRQNLFLVHQEWDHDQAVTNAITIVESVQVKRVVLCGQRVGEAFGFGRYFDLHRHAGVDYTVIPHPNGMNRMYNDVNARVAARATVQWAANCILAK